MAKHKSKGKGCLLGVLLVAVLCGAVCFFAVPSVLKTLYPAKYDNFVETYTREYDLEKSFVFAVIKCESSFDPQAVSSVGARGLMQIMPETFEWLQWKTGESLPDDALFDPETSIRYGCLYYQYLIREFGSEALAVCAYHAGSGNVRKWLADERYSSDGKTLDSVPFNSTASYLKNVMKAKELYRRLYHIN